MSKEGVMILVGMKPQSFIGLTKIRFAVRLPLILFVCIEIACAFPLEM